MYRLKGRLIKRRERGREGGREGGGSLLSPKLGTNLQT